VDPLGRSALRQIGRLLLDGVREPPSLLLIELLDYLDAGFRRSVRTFQYMLEDRIEEKLPWVSVPTLVVRGSRDPIVPQRWAEEATKLLPAGWLVVIPGATHTANYGSPLELARVVRAFLDTNREPPPMRQNA
jgi:pimeloyl-ACP methyl ester carboxylesterase